MASSEQRPLSMVDTKARLDLVDVVDEGSLREVVRLLRLDHYLRLDVAELDLLHPIVRRAWRAQRGL